MILTRFKQHVYTWWSISSRRDNCKNSLKTFEIINVLTRNINDSSMLHFPFKQGWFSYMAIDSCGIGHMAYCYTKIYSKFTWWYVIATSNILVNREVLHVILMKINKTVHSNDQSSPLLYFSLCTEIVNILNNYCISLINLMILITY